MQLVKKMLSSRSLGERGTMCLKTSPVKLKRRGFSYQLQISIEKFGRKWQSKSLKPNESQQKRLAGHRVPNQITFLNREKFQLPKGSSNSYSRISTRIKIKPSSFALRQLLPKIVEIPNQISLFSWRGASMNGKSDSSFQKLNELMNARGQGLKQTLIALVEQSLIRAETDGTAGWVNYAIIAELASKRVHDETNREIISLMLRRDPMTGIRNWLGMEEQIEIAEDQFGDGLPMGVTRIDFKGLRSINNFLGHFGANRVIQSGANEMATVFEAATIFEMNLRTGSEFASTRDLVFRDGGDEFLVLSKYPNLQPKKRRVENESGMGDGKPRRRTLRPATRAEVETSLNEIEVRLRRVINSVPAPMENDPDNFLDAHIFSEVVVGSVRAAVVSVDKKMLGMKEAG